MVKIENINKADIDIICDLADVIFQEHMSNNKAYVFSATNWDISIKLTYNGDIFGFYLFKDSNLYQNIFNDKKGIQGVALGVTEEYRIKAMVNY